MIDALMYAVRDGIRAANIGYGPAECELMDDGRPPPMSGNYFLAIHDASISATGDNQLDERYQFSATLTMRLIVPLDKLGNQQIYRNIQRVPLGERQGFYAKLDRIKALLHMNWKFTVLTQQSPPSANDNLVAWATGEVYGFCEPMRFKTAESPKLVFADWFQADAQNDSELGIKATMTFGDCRRFQPVTQASGPFV